MDEDSVNVIEMELGLPIPGVSYSSLKVRAARRLPSRSEFKGRTQATGLAGEDEVAYARAVRDRWDALTDELLAAHKHEAARIREAVRQGT